MMRSQKKKMFTVQLATNQPTAASERKLTWRRRGRFPPIDAEERVGAQWRCTWGTDAWAQHLDRSGNRGEAEACKGRQVPGAKPLAGARVDDIA